MGSMDAPGCWFPAAVGRGNENSYSIFKSPVKMGWLPKDSIVVIKMRSNRLSKTHFSLSPIQLVNSPPSLGLFAEQRSSPFPPEFPARPPACGFQSSSALLLLALRLPPSAHSAMVLRPLAAIALRPLAAMAIRPRLLRSPPSARSPP